VLAQSASKHSLGLQARSSRLLRKHKQPLGSTSGLYSMAVLSAEGELRFGNWLLFILCLQGERELKQEKIG
jgi:hypothetical protein